MISHSFLYVYQRVDSWHCWYMASIQNPYKMVHWIGFVGKSSLKTKVFTIKYRVFRSKRSFKPIQWIKIEHINQVFFTAHPGYKDNECAYVYVYVCVYIYIMTYRFIPIILDYIHSYITYIYIIYILEVVHLSLIYQWINHVPVNCSRTTENKTEQDLVIWWFNQISPSHNSCFDDSVG